MSESNFSFNDDDDMHHLMSESYFVMLFCGTLVSILLFIAIAIVVWILMELWTPEVESEPIVDAPGPGHRGDGMHVVHQIFLHNMMMAQLQNIQN